MATPKDMARIVVMERMKSAPYPSVFDDVSLMNDDDLKAEYSGIVKRKMAAIQEQRAILDAQEADLSFGEDPQ